LRANSTFERPFSRHELPPSGRKPRADAPHRQASTPDQPANPAGLRQRTLESLALPRAPIGERTPHREHHVRACDVADLFHLHVRDPRKFGYRGNELGADCGGCLAFMGQAGTCAAGDGATGGEDGDSGKRLLGDVRSSLLSMQRR
jgi:hypothetical protein